MLTRMVAEEVSDTGIRVYGFHPGMVNTDMTREGLKKHVNAVSRMSVDEFLHPAEPASAISALCRDRPAEFQGLEVRYSEPGFMRWLDKAQASYKKQ
jgi:NAD(P)-dependent dehydrogenase (short-subunit alcohol dehydrogenase family)